MTGEAFVAGCASVPAVSTTIATSGAGTTVVSRGRQTMKSIPTATIGFTGHGTSMR